MIGVSEWRFVWFFKSWFLHFFLVSIVINISSLFFKVLKCLNQFIQNFSSLIKSEFEGMFIPKVLLLSLCLSSIFYLFDKMLFLVVVLGPLWSTFVSSLRVYEQASIEGTEDSYEGRYDSDGSEISLESFVIQVTITAISDVYYFDDLIMEVIFCYWAYFHVRVNRFILSAMSDFCNQ